MKKSPFTKRHNKLTKTFLLVTTLTFIATTIITPLSNYPVNAAIIPAELTEIMNKGISRYDPEYDEPCGDCSPDASIQKLIDGLPVGATASVGYQRLDNVDTQHIIGSSDKMFTASVIKLWVAAAALSIDADAQLEQMISYSNSTATNEVIDAVGGAAAVDTYIKNQGYTNTNIDGKIGALGDTATTSADMLTFLKNLYENKLNQSTEDSAALLEAMKNQSSYIDDGGNSDEFGAVGAPCEACNKIHKALEGEINSGKVKYLANKTGENPGVRNEANDVAIISTDQGDFLLTIFVNGGDNYDANVQFNRDVAITVYDELQACGGKGGPSSGIDTSVEINGTQGKLSEEQIKNADATAIALANAEFKWTDSKLNAGQLAGILANSYNESTFNPTTENASSLAYGLFQILDGRKLIPDPSSIISQVIYLVKILSDGSYGPDGVWGKDNATHQGQIGMHQFWSAKDNDFKTPALAFAASYERFTTNPSDPEYENRVKDAEIMYNRYKGLCGNASCGVNTDFMDDEKWIYFSQAYPAITITENSRKYAATGPISASKMWSSGCGITSHAMGVANFNYNDTSINPFTFATKIGLTSSYQLWYWSYFNSQKSNNSYGLSYTTSLSKDDWEKELKNGSLITTGTNGVAANQVSTGYKINGNHVIIVRGITDDGKFKISDPGNRANGHALVDKAVLKASAENNGVIKKCSGGSCPL